MPQLDSVVEDIKSIIRATNYNLNQLQDNLKLIRSSLNGDYSQKKFVEAVNKLTPNSFTVPGLSKIESGAYNLSVKNAKSIIVFLSSVHQDNKNNIRFINLLSLFNYAGHKFDEEKQKNYSKKILSSPLIDKEIIDEEKYIDASVTFLEHYQIMYNRNIEDILLVDIRSQLSNNLKSLRLICGGSIKDFAELLDVPVETYKHYDSNKIKLNYNQCEKLLSKISEKYSENPSLSKIISLIANRYYENFAKEIESSIKNYALSNNMSEDIKENLYANSIVYLDRYISFHNGSNEGLDIKKAVSEKWLRPLRGNNKYDTLYVHIPEDYNKNCDESNQIQELFDKDINEPLKDIFKKKKNPSEAAKKFYNGHEEAYDRVCNLEHVVGAKEIALSNREHLVKPTFRTKERAVNLGQNTVDADFTSGAIVGLGALAGGITAALISTFFLKKRSKDSTRIEEYKKEIDSIKKEIKTLSKEDREELINLIKECDEDN